MIGCSYQIFHHEYGIIVKGSVPALDFFSLISIFKSIYGYDYKDVKISRFYDATICLTNQENAKKWRNFLHIIDDVGEEFNRIANNFQFETFTKTCL